jgi:hypothetical protein
MKYFATSTAILFFGLVSSSSALAPTPSTNRRAFINEIVTSATIATSFAVGSADPVFAENYSLDVGEVEVRTTTKDKKKNDGGKIVGGALAAGSLLSVPFFLPNLLRLAGVKNAKNPTVVDATSKKKGSATSTKKAGAGTKTATSTPKKKNMFGL